MTAHSRFRSSASELVGQGGPAGPSQYALNLSHRGGTQSVLLGLVPEDSRVLDLGCASGYLGAKLHQRGCTVWGIDADATAVDRIPRDAYESVIHADLDSLCTWPLPPHSVDVVLAADVLEHLKAPEELLSRVHEVLTPDGLLVVSLPNVAHISVRLPLLFGSFRYRSCGILDRTHLHLYTFATARELVGNSGSVIESVLSGADWSGWILNHPRTRRIAGVLRGMLATGIIITARAER